MEHVLIKKRYGQAMFAWGFVIIGLALLATLEVFPLEGISIFIAHPIFVVGLAVITAILALAGYALASKDYEIKSESGRVITPDSQLHNLMVAVELQLKDVDNLLKDADNTRSHNHRIAYETLIQLANEAANNDKIKIKPSVSAAGSSEEEAGEVTIEELVARVKNNLKARLEHFKARSNAIDAAKAQIDTQKKLSASEKENRIRELYGLSLKDFKDTKDSKDSDLSPARLAQIQAALDNKDLKDSDKEIVIYAALARGEIEHSDEVDLQNKVLPHLRALGPNPRRLEILKAILEGKKLTHSEQETEVRSLFECDPSGIENMGAKRLLWDAEQFQIELFKDAARKSSLPNLQLEKPVTRSFQIKHATTFVISTLALTIGILLLVALIEGGFPLVGDDVFLTGLGVTVGIVFSAVLALATAYSFFKHHYEEAPSVIVPSRDQVAVEKAIEQRKAAEVETERLAKAAEVEAKNQAKAARAAELAQQRAFKARAKADKQASKVSNGSRVVNPLAAAANQAARASAVVPSLAVPGTDAAAVLSDTSAPAVVLQSALLTAAATTQKPHSPAKKGWITRFINMLLGDRKSQRSSLVANRGSVRVQNPLSAVPGNAGGASANTIPNALAAAGGQPAGKPDHGSNGKPLRASKQQATTVLDAARVEEQAESDKVPLVAHLPGAVQQQDGSAGSDFTSTRGVRLMSGLSGGGARPAGSPPDGTAADGLIQGNGLATNTY